MSHKKVCFTCRKAFALSMDFETSVSMICPECGHEAYFMNYKFRPPKKSDNKAWEVAAFLRDHGFYFQAAYEMIDRGVYLRVPYPQSMQQAKEFVLKYQPLGTRK